MNPGLTPVGHNSSHHESGRLDVVGASISEEPLPDVEGVVVTSLEVPWLTSEPLPKV